MAHLNLSGNWEHYCLNQAAGLAETDLAAQAPALGLNVNVDGRVTVRLFGRDYLVGNQAVEAADGRPVAPLHQGLLAHYLRSRGRAGLTGQWLPIGRLTGMAVSGASPSGNLIRPLTDRFGDRYAAFAEAAQKVGGRHQGLSSSGGEAWLFHDLPFFPVQVVFFEADDEFPAEVQVLFDSSAPIFIAYECLELMEMALVGELLSAAGLLGCGGGCDCDHHGAGCG